MESKQGLAGGVLSLFDSVVMAIAGSAPAYSLSATTALLIGAVGALAPASLLWCGIPMLGVVLAFYYLNRWEANAGASYAWVGKALSSELGFMAGWALVVSATIFMVAGSFPAGSVTLDILDPKLANNLPAVTVVGGLWFAIITVFVMLGIRITANVQWVMTSVEMLLLIVSGVVAAVKFGVHPAQAFQWRWFSPAAFPSTSVFIAGALIATFYYWGWDVSVNLNEESQESRRVPGLGALIGIFFIFAMYEFYTIITQLGFTPKEVGALGTNLLPALGTRIYGKGWGNILALAVALSTIATLETTLLQVTRTLFAMGRDRVVSRRFAAIHPAWRTPYLASIVIGAFGLALFIASNFLASVNTVMSDAVNAIGLQVVFYYSLAALAVIVYYRRVLFRSVANFVFLGLWPAVAAVFLLVVGIADVPSLGLVTDLVGLGLLALGVLPLLWGRQVKRVAFYAQGREAYEPGGAAGVAD
jgi:amino acid transporter